MKLFNIRRARSAESLADAAAAVNTAMHLQEELSNLTVDELELCRWGAQHVSGLRVCGGTPTVSDYLGILRLIRDSEHLR